MKLSNKTISCFLLLVSCFFFISCGGGNAIDKITGPNFDTAELKAIRVDQLKFNGGLAFDKDGIPNPALYLRCANKDVDIVCAGANEGLDIVKKNGIIYGRLNAGFIPVKDVEEGSCFDSVKLLFVAKHSNDCPSGIKDDDEIVWTSQALSLNELGEGSLLNKEISDDETGVMAYLVGPSDEFKEDVVSAQAEKTNGILTLDQLYFKTPDITADTAQMKLVVKDKDDGGTFWCETPSMFDWKTYGVTKEDIIYGNLNIELVDTTGTPCTITEEGKSIYVKISLYFATEDKTLATSAPLTVGDLTNKNTSKKLFDEDGFVKFSPLTEAE